MQDLHLVGYTTDRRHLIFSTRQGAKSGSFLVPVDEALLEAIDDLATEDDDAEEIDEEVELVPPAPRVEAQLSVREVQARLRAGDPVGRIASDAGVDEEWVQRFAPPVRAEQRQIVERALATEMERPRSGRSSVPLRRAVAAAMAERGVTFTAESFEGAWSSRLVGAERWELSFTFVHRSRSRTVHWVFDTATGTLTADDRTASQLGFVAADTTVPPESETIGTPGQGTTAATGELPSSSPRRGRSRGGAGRRTGARSSSGTTRRSGGTRAATKAASKKAAAKKVAAKKAAAKKAAAKKAAAKKAAAKKAAAKKAAAKKAAAKKAASKRAPAKRAATSNKAPAKRAATSKTARAKKPATKKKAAEKKAAAKKAAPTKAETQVAAPEAPRRGVATQAPAAASRAVARPAPSVPAEVVPVRQPPAPATTAAPDRHGAAPRATSAPAPQPSADAPERAAPAPRPAPERASAPPAARAVPAEPRPANEPASPARPAPEVVRVRPAAAPDGPVHRITSDPSAHRIGGGTVVRPPAGDRGAPSGAPAEAIEVRRARPADRSLPTAQFRSGSAVRARSADANGAVGPVPATDGRSADPSGDPGANGRRSRRARQLRAR